MMKKLLFVMLASVSVATGCRKIDVKAVEMDVQVSKDTYRVGETVQFNITGDVQNITFYSGEDRAAFDDAGKAILDQGKPQLEFRSVLGGGKRDNSLKVLVSNDLTKVDAASIAAATWIDITNKATLAASTTGTPSGPIDLTAFAQPNMPLRVAFRYESATSATLAHPIWNISSFTITTFYNDGTFTPIATLANALWTQVNIKNPAAVWTISSSQVRIDGGAKATADNEDWVVTGPLDLQATRELANYGKSIKNLASSPINSYQHVFSKPGTYTVTFVGFNNSIDVDKRIIKQFKITVTN